MFIQLIDRTYLNTDEIAEIKFALPDSSPGNALIIMKDGRQRDVYLSEHEVERLCFAVIPAPSGYSAHRPYDIDFDDVPETIRWSPVIAFVVDGSEYPLTPITAEDGRLEKYAVRCPDGRVYTSLEEFFDSVGDYESVHRAQWEKRNKVA